MGGAEVPTDATGPRMDPATGLQLLGTNIDSRLAHMADLRGEAEGDEEELDELCATRTMLEVEVLEASQ